MKEFFSDRGTNVNGGTRELGVDAIFIEDPTMKSFLQDRRAVCKFNTPISSHMGGIWECLIGIIRRIINSILLEAKHACT